MVSSILMNEKYFKMLFFHNWITVYSSNLKLYFKINGFCLYEVNLHKSAYEMFYK